MIQKIRWLWCAVALLLCTTVSAATPLTVIPGGNTIGLQMQTEGVSVVDFSEQEPKKAGMKSGDLICEADGTAVSTAAELTKAVQASCGAPMHLTIRRGDEVRKITLAPHRAKDGWCLGIFVRDSISGIGTVTYYTDEGGFGALGHAICGADGSLLPMREGAVLQTQIVSVIKGRQGAAGALQGAVNGRRCCGVLLQNTKQGIFGTMQPPEGKAVPIGTRTQAHTGAATILSNIRGSEVCAYSVQVSEIFPNDGQGRNFLLKVTDKALLEKTGGIVQGMSGSPILQDGRLIGAVTHVLLDDPTQGYGIFIEAMLEAQNTPAENSASVFFMPGLAAAGASPGSTVAAAPIALIQP